MNCENTIWLMTVLMSREYHGFLEIVEVLAPSLANVSGMIPSVVTFNGTAALLAFGERRAGRMTLIDLCATISLSLPLNGREAVLCSEKDRLVKCLQ